MYLARVILWTLEAGSGVILWTLYAPIGLLKSTLGLIAGVLAFLAAIIYAEAEPYALLPGFLIFIFHRMLNQRPIPTPYPIPAFPVSRKVKRVPVPIVAGLKATQDAPSVREALGRLSPRLREVIANPPREPGA